MADYVSLRNSIDDPDLLARRYGLEGRTPADRVTAPLVTAAWQAPWERARTERLLHLLYAGWLRGTEARFAALVEEQERLRQEPRSRARAMAGRLLNGWLPADGDSEGGLTAERLGDWVGASWLPDVLRHQEVPLALVQALSRADVRGHRLVLALALYQAKEGRPAPDLEALVRAGYLAELPRDPFGEQVFHYRVSAGEVMQWDPQAPSATEGERPVPAGTGVVWSVGPDLHDGGGTRQGLGTSAHRLFGPNNNFDLIFLVLPLPRK
jgi:hypothetical protein